MRKTKKKKIENKPFFDYKDTTVILAIVCAALITRMLFMTNHINCNGMSEIIGAVVGTIFVLTIAINWLCETMVNIGSGKEKSLSQTVKSNDREKTHNKCHSVPNIAQRKEKIKDERNYKQ